MAHLFQPTYTRKIPAAAKRVKVRRQSAWKWTGRDGEPVIGYPCRDKPGRCEVAVRIWWIAYEDERGEPRITRGSRDKDSAAAEMANIVRRVEQVKAGILPAGAVRGRRLLSVLAEEYRDHLAALNNSAGHVREVYHHVTAACEGCEFRVFGDLDGVRLTVWLADLRTRQQGKGSKCKDGVGITTSNHYLSAMKAFSAWLAGRLKCYDPLAHLERLNAETDLRTVRRAVTRAEFESLMQATQASTWTFRGLTGPDRGMLYLVASMTGLRAAELASLTRESLDLEGGVLEVEAAFSKHKRRDLVPLAAELMRRVREWLPGSGQLWPGTWYRRGAEMLRHDLAAASIPYTDGRGRVFDLHALRGQFITDLARAGVSITLAQRLARHSTPTLTAKAYTHLEIADLQGAVDRLGATAQEKRATG